MGERRNAHASERELRAGDVLASALAECRAALSNVAARELIDELGEPEDDLPSWLAAAESADPERREVLGDILGSVARRLAGTGEAPIERAAAEAWDAVAIALDRIFGSGVQLLGRLPFVTDALLALLLAEAGRQLPPLVGVSRRAPGPPGRTLAALAVSPKLRDAVAAAFGFSVEPTYDAVYLYDPPGSHVRTHVDSRDYELVVHLVLEHARPRDGSRGSALVVHLPAEPEPLRLFVEPGEAVALRGRGTVHSWDVLRDDEHRVVTAIGFASRG